LVISDDLPFIDKKAEELCGHIPEPIASPLGSFGTIGSVLFPGKFIYGTTSLGLVPKAEIIPDRHGMVEAWLVGCIIYRDQFNILYKTRFYYWYVDQNTNRPKAFPVPPPGTEMKGRFEEHHSSVQ
jgi:hypothetical protein